MITERRTSRNRGKWMPQDEALGLVHRPHELGVEVDSERVVSYGPHKFCLDFGLRFIAL